MLGLTDRRLLVVGASSGMGRAAALSLARSGASVAFASRRREALDEAVSEAGSGTVITLDVLDEQDVERGVTEAAAALGGLDGILYTRVGPHSRFDITSIPGEERKTGLLFPILDDIKLTLRPTVM